jgi:antitoxin (DNA-binding transcriptional repressor) of toxin-antitoxin stability system
MIISDFKAKCIATVKRVERHRDPVLLTIRGRPVAEVCPVSSPPAERRLGIHRDLAWSGDVPVHEDWDGEWSSETVPPPKGKPAAQK